MSKEAAAWLAVRIIGLLLLGATLCELFGTLVHVVTAEKLSNITGNLAPQAERQALRAWVDTGISLARAAFLGALAFYFLRKGKALHRLLMWETK